MRKDLFRWLSAMTALGLLASTVVGCSPKGPAGGVAKAEELKSDRPRLEAPSVGEAQVPGLVDGNSEFALDLYRVLFASDKNLFYSPYSISLALAMTYAGAKGETEREMAEVLHFAMGQDSLHQAFHALDQALASRGQQVKEDDQRFRLHIANALWGQQGFAFLASFLDTLAGNYGAGMRLVDFQSSPENARHTINQWVEDQTEDKIKDVLPPGSIDALTRLVLSNAIYFNASWMHPFEKRATKDGAFHLLDGSTVTVPMMQQGERLGYADGANYQAVELPYVGGELSMVVLLPAEGTFGDFARQLDAAQLDAIFSDITQMRVNLTMPKFEYEAGFELKGALQRLGMKSAFDTAADFSGMTGRPELFISDVYHKAFVKVDEEGTEAAAATAVVMKLTAAPAVPVEIKVDRSFIFLIRDVETGAIVFLGHVVNPAA